MATLIVKRSSEWANRLRNLNLVLNGKPLGTIANGEIKNFTLPTGRHQFKSTIDWTGSPEIEIELQESEPTVVEVKTSAGFRWLIRLALVTTPLFFLLLYFPHLSEQYSVLNYLYLLLMGSSLLFMIYKFTLGRKSYLELEIK